MMDFTRSPSTLEVLSKVTACSSLTGISPSRSEIRTVRGSTRSEAGSVGERPDLVPHAAEVDRIMWVSLAELQRPGTYREERWGTPPLDRPIFFFELDDETIWGATAKMVHQLLRLAHGVDEPEPQS